MKNLALISELLQTSASACDNFIKSQIALEDGDVQVCQNASQKGVQLIKAMIKDSFEEFEEEFDAKTSECLDYDYPNNMELIKALNSLSVNVGGLLGSEDDKIADMFAKKIQISINTIKEIYLALFENQKGFAF